MAKLLDQEILHLDQDGHSDLANTATNNEISTEKLKALSADRLNALKLEVARMRIQDSTKPELTKLLDEAIASKVNPTSPATPSASPAWVSTKWADGTKEGLRWVPSDIATAANAARAQVKSTFGDVTDRDYQSHMTFARQALKFIPWLEVSSREDIADALYQPDKYINDLIDYLENASSRNISELEFWSTGSMNPLNMILTAWAKIKGEKIITTGPGVYPSATVELWSIEKKNEYIKAMLLDLTESLKWRKSSDIFDRSMVADAGWISLTVLGMYVWGKVALSAVNSVLNRVTFGLWGKWAATVAASNPWVVERAKKVWAVGRAIYDRARGNASKPWAAAAAAPWTATSAWPVDVPARELDMKRTLDRMAHENILKEIYRQSNGWIAGTPDQIKELGDAIKNAIASPAEIAEYNNRVARYIELWDRPITDAKKMAEWDAKLERVIVWEKDPKKWQFKENARVKAAAPAAAANLQTRLRQAAADAKPIEFRVGSDVYDIIPAAEKPLRDLQILQDTIADNEAKLKELQEAQKKLEARLALENEYGKLTKRLTDIWTALPAQQTVVNNALATADGHSVRFKYPADSKNPTWRQLVDVDSLKLDPLYKADKAIYDRENAKLDSLIAEEKSLRETKLPWIDSQLRGLTGKPSSSLSRYGKSNFVFDLSGNLTDSLTKQKLDNPLSAWYTPDAPGNSGVKAQIGHYNSEIAQNYRDLDIKMGELHTLNSKFPNAWKKAGLIIDWIKVSKVGLILESGIKLFKK